MKIKQIVLSTTAALFMSANIQAITSLEVSRIDEVMNKGILINKQLASDSAVDLKLFKAYTKDSIATAILRIKNLTNKEIKVKDYVDYGTAIKKVLMPNELTYILVEDGTEQISKRKMRFAEIEKEIKVKIKNDMSVVNSFLSESVNIYNIKQISPDEYEPVHVFKKDFMKHMEDINKFDYIEYTKINIQNSLYHGMFFSGYEINKKNIATPTTYYFIIDELTNKISIIYKLEGRISYNSLKNIILQKLN